MKKTKPRGKGSFVRMCSACGIRKLKNEMIRVSAKKDGTVCIDNSGKIEGRGVYICRDNGCIQKTIKAKRLSRLLKTEVSELIYEELIGYILLKEEK